MIGVVYKFQPHNKLNGTLFYCFEYAAFLNAPLYVVGISDKDLLLVRKIFSEKYTTPPDFVVPVSVTNLYSLGLEKTLILDVKTFYGCKEFLTNEVHVFSNEPHEMFRYKNDRSVTYYGSYPYQQYDVFNYLKLNFNIFKKLERKGNGAFISGPIVDGYEYPEPTKLVITKKHDRGLGNLFELIDVVHYIHTGLDTNNRIIPEAVHYGKDVTIVDKAPEVVDSVVLRYEDIQQNGLINYTLTTEDEMVKACLRSSN